MAAKWLARLWAIIKRLLEKPEPEPEPEPTTPQDDLDPTLIVWDEPAGDVGAWPITATLSGCKVTTTTIEAHRSPADSWPHVQLEGWSKPSVGNWWVICREEGSGGEAIYHGATIEWLGIGKVRIPQRKWDGTDDLHGYLGTWRPYSGETAYLMQSTHARSGVIGGNCQRTNIVRVVWP